MPGGLGLESATELIMAITLAFSVGQECHLLGKPRGEDVLGYRWNVTRE